MAEQELTHHGVMGMKWGVRRYQPYGKGESGKFLGKTSGKAKTKSKNVKAGGSTPDSEIASRTAKINQIKKSNGGVSKKELKRIKKLENDIRIIKEVQAHEKKTGDKGYAKRFMDSYDDLEMWDMHSPSELKVNKISNVGNTDKKAQKLEKKKLVKAQKAWDKHTKENWLTVYNETVNTANKTIVPKINAKYAKYDWTKLDLSSGRPKGDPKLVANYEKYESEHADAFDSLLNKNYDDVFGKRPT